MEKLNATITIESKPLTKSLPIMAERTDIAANPSDQVRVVGPDDCEKAAECLAEAFMNDDVAKYFIFTEPGSPKTWNTESLRLHRKICEYLVYAHYMKGLVTVAGPNYDSVALWMPPASNDIDDWFTMFKSGMWRLRYQLSAEGCKRFFTEFLPLLSQAKAAALGADDNNSWYLVYIGTRPGSEGKGYAKALIEMVTQQADAEGVKCYLESSHKKNLEFYQRRGFEQHPEVGLSKICLTRDASKSIELDIMVRKPRPENFEPHTVVPSRDLEKRDAANGIHLNGVLNPPPPTTT